MPQDQASQDETPQDDASLDDATSQDRDADSETREGGSNDPIAVPGSRGYFKRGTVRRDKGPKIRWANPTVR